MMLALILTPLWGCGGGGGGSSSGLKSAITASAPNAQGVSTIIGAPGTAPAGASLIASLTNPPVVFPLVEFGPPCNSNTAIAASDGSFAMTICNAIVGDTVYVFEQPGARFSGSMELGQVVVP